MKTKRLHLVWNDASALDRLAVRLACNGSTLELEAHLAMRRRRYPVYGVPSDRGADWRMNSDYFPAELAVALFDGLEISSSAEYRPGD